MPVLKLSICIPTYNRSTFLKEALDSIAPQLRDDVEVVISDNASQDATQSVVESYRPLIPNLTYVKQPENIGRDRNYLAAVAAARGEFCWLFGDDDLIVEGGVGYLLNGYLNGTRPVDFALLLVTSYDSNMQVILEQSADVLGITEDLYTTDVLSFFTRFYQESYLSIFVVRRQRWNSVDAEKYVGTGLTYLGITYEYLEADSPVVLIAKPLVKYRSQNVSWTSDTLDIILHNQRQVMDMLPERYDPVKPAAYAIYEKRTPVTLKMLCFLRSQRSYDLSLYRKYLRQYFRDRAMHKLLAFAIATAPPQIMQAIRRVYQWRRAGREAAPCI